MDIKTFGLATFLLSTTSLVNATEVKSVNPFTQGAPLASEEIKSKSGLTVASSYCNFIEKKRWKGTPMCN